MAYMVCGDALFVLYLLPVQQLLLLGQLLVSKPSNIGLIQRWQKAVTTFILQTEKYETGTCI